MGVRKKYSRHFVRLSYLSRFTIFLVALFLSACASRSPQESIDRQEAAKTRISLGLTYLQNGSYAQAKANLDKALKFAPELTDVHFALAYYYQTIDEIVLAEKSYQKALSINSEDADLLNSYGAFLCLQGHYQLAEDYLHKAIQTQQYSHAAASYENLAICQQAQADTAQAIRYLETAISHDPTRIKTAYLLLELNVSQKRWEEAQKALTRYERLAPVTAQTLDYAVKIQKALGNMDIADGYAKTLLKLYPEHDIAKKYLKQTSPELKQIQNPALEKKSMSDRIHVVQPGENLYRISLKYNVRMQRLIEWNNLTDGTPLHTGKKLFVSDPNAN
ncbi:type IV pilus biogenesis/stability protein PilW [Alteromonas sp. a30]|uniref:type IV pilus biogenesis/stability protein PilW n=1 Tax=Alteromonas sp. a30 TaxID=2730917 RepID=UPI002281C682|nr:type IV pilus biogenesis/stability protein PilW [Alteromonas sp. a30]MCY7294590.1 type IV pilus biogenesis/stability protein PilW [Alteromonas sp. a30]